MSTLTIDIRMLHHSGIGTYLRNLVPSVAGALNDLNINLLGNEEELQEYSWSRGKNINIINCTSNIYSLTEQMELLKKTPSRTDVFWSPHINIPLMFRGKLLVTVHDAFFLANPQFVWGFHKQLYARFMFNTLSRKATHIITPSNFTKKELQHYLKLDVDKVSTIYNGVQEGWFHLTKEEFPNNKPYLLYVGNVKPHKNLKALLIGFDIIKEKIKHDIIIVGKKDGFITGDDEIAHMASTMGDRVKFTGYITDDELKQYYVHADALVFPSIYEGFGLPPIEAMACGCPSIVSKAASIPEICDSATLYFDPFNPQDIASKIEMLVNDNNLRNDIVQKGLSRARQFLWDKSAKETIGVIEEVLSS
jgi:glycosyltransferase involved in cell wall biosynthesis